MLAWALLIGSLITMGVLIHDEVDWQMEPEEVSERQLRSMISLLRLLVIFAGLLYVNIMAWLPTIQTAV